MSVSPCFYRKKSVLLQALSTLGSKTENWQIVRGNLSKFLRGGRGGGGETEEPRDLGYS